MVEQSRRRNSDNASYAGDSETIAELSSMILPNWLDFFNWTLRRVQRKI